MDILVWGCNDFSKCLMSVLRGSRVNVRAFIDNAENTLFCGKPVMRPSSVKADAGFNDLSIIIASSYNVSNDTPSSDSESIRQFKITLQEIIVTYKLKNRLLHPCALVDFVDMPNNMKIITYGLQGSGNTIYNNIMRQLRMNPLELKSPLVKGVARLITSVFSNRVNANKFFEPLCYEYNQIVHQVICDAIYQAGGTQIHGAPFKTGTSHFSCLTDDQCSLNVFSFPTRDYMFASSYGYHKLPTLNTLERLKMHQCNVFFIMRNPLDMILSVLNKAAAIDENTKAMNQRFFVNHALPMMDQLKRWHSMRHKANVLYYENLLKDPIKQILSLASMIGLSLTPAAAKEIWGSVSFRRLPGATKDNFWQGGSGKWEQYFNEEHLALFKHHGMEELLEMYGYHDALLAFQEKTKYLSLEFQKEVSSRFMIDYVGYPFGFDDDNTISLMKHLYGDGRYVELDHVIMGSESVNFLKKIEGVFNSNFIKAISLCGSHPDYRVV